MILIWLCCELFQKGFESVFGQTKVLELQMGRADLRLARVDNLSRRAREEASRKEAQGSEMVKAFGMKVLRHHARSKNLSLQDRQVNIFHFESLAGIV